METQNFEPFSLSNDQEVGRFDKDMNFVWTRKELNEEEQQDAWIQGK